MSFGQVLGIIDDRADDLAATEVVRAVGADLHLEVVEASLHGLARKPRDFLVAVSEPASRSDVCRVPDLAGVGLALRLGGCLGLEHRKGFFLGDGVGDVTEGSRVDQLLLQMSKDHKNRFLGARCREGTHRGHVDHKLPKWLVA